MTTDRSPKTQAERALRVSPATVAGLELLSQMGFEEDHGALSTTTVDHWEATILAIEDEAVRLALSPERIAEALGYCGVEPDMNICTCGHHGGHHDLNNVCLDCGDRFAGIGLDEATERLAAALSVRLLEATR